MNTHPDAKKSSFSCCFMFQDTCTSRSGPAAADMLSIRLEGLPQRHAITSGIRCPWSQSKHAAHGMHSPAGQVRRQRTLTAPGRMKPGLRLCQEASVMRM